MSVSSFTDALHPFDRVSAGVPAVRRAPSPAAPRPLSPAEAGGAIPFPLTAGQQIARAAITMLVLAGSSALFATQIFAVLR